MVFTAKLIQAEVQASLQVDPSLSLDNCQTKCDAMFDLDLGHDEKVTDNMCKEACDWWVIWLDHS